MVLAGWPGPPLHLIKSRNSSVQRGKRSSSTEKTLLIKLSDTILHYLHTDTHIKCAKKWLRLRRYFLGWKGIGIYYLPSNAGSVHLLNIYWGVLLFLGRHFGCRPLDPTLDIWSNFVKKEKKIFYLLFSFISFRSPSCMAIS